MSSINIISDCIAFFLRPDKANDPTNTKGFTLLEILIAIFIFAVVVSIIFTSYTGTFRVIDQTESQADMYAMARTALARMQEDLESVYFSKSSEASESEEDTVRQTRFVGEDKEIKGRDADNLRFLSRAHLVFDEEDKDSGTAEITYYVSENEEGDGFVLYRSDTPVFEEAPEEGTGGLILCDGVFSVNFTYYDAGGEVYDIWDSTEEEFEGLPPAMVSISLEFINKTNPEAPLKFMTGVALPMAGDKYGKTP